MIIEDGRKMKSRVRDLSRSEERRFDIQTEQHFSRHRGMQAGRDFRWNTFRHEDFECDGKTAAQNLNAHFDEVFPEAPGSPAWFDRKFGKKG